MYYKKLELMFIMLLVGSGIFAQGTLDDYQRAYELKERFNKDKMLYADVKPEWVKGTHFFWYVRNTSEERQYVVVDADKKNRKEMFNHQKMSVALSGLSGKEVKENQIRLENLRLNVTLDTLRFVFGSNNWQYAIHENNLVKASPVALSAKRLHWMEVDDEKKADPVTSPDENYQAFIRNHNIYIKELASGKEKQLSMDGTLGNYYSTHIQWSPDSKKVVSCKIRPIEKRYVYFVESSPADQLQPKLHKQEYAKPGDELRFKIPCIYEVENGNAIIPSTDLFNRQFDITYIKWNEDSRAVTFEYNQRGHQAYRILELSVENGIVRPLVEETSRTFVNWLRRFRYDLSNGKGMIWMSERDNWNHLYMYNRETGKVDYQITKGKWYVRDVVRVDEDKHQIYFSANGLVLGEDPYLIRYYRIDFNGENLICLTPEEGMHQAWFSDDMCYLVDVYSMVDKAPVAVLRDSKDGKVVMPLEIANISGLLAEGWTAPEVFTAKGRDNQTDIWGIIVRPTNFDPNKKYPVIEYIYSGPGSHYVPKTFIPYNQNMTALAELGFIVIQSDGMGTSFRSKAFEDICYKNLKDAGFPDRKSWIKAAAAKYSYMDIDRIGIFGASAGGQEAMTGVLFHPEFYKAAYSACGCHDNRMDKVWWNEQWLGYPVDNSYTEGSNVENAHLLTHPLMLVVGELDDNVDPASTMQVVNALIKANKDFELIVLPGVTHTMGGDYGEHKRFDFFVKHLLGVDPPKWNLLKY